MATDSFKDIEKLEADLWESADNLRANSKLTSSDYFMPVLGVIFLRHAANRFDAAQRQIHEDQAAGRMPKRKIVPADYIRRRSLWLPENARYDWIMEKASSDGDLPKLVTKAMNAIEADFTPLKGVLPKDYGIFEPKVLEDLMRLFNSERIKQANGDVFGRIYEYFLAEFSIQKAHDNGEFFTPSSLVQMIVNVIEPDHGAVFDPACGSGGMFVQSSHFIEQEGEDASKRVVFYGQEKNNDTIRIAKMNLAVHGLEGNIVDAITYYQDEHNLVGKCDFVMANPPFNVNLVDAERIKGEPRLPFGLPGVNKNKRVSNGNYLWVSYFWSYLNEKGRAGFVMSSQASSAGHGEKDVRKKIIETGDVDVMISIRSNFFYTRSVPCELWFFDRGKVTARKDKVLNHQVLGVNNAVASVQHQEALKRKFPVEERLRYRTAIVEQKALLASANVEAQPVKLKTIELPIIERIHPDLGRLGVFWHTQGSGKSYSMAFFAEKVRRTIAGNFTFVLLTDRGDLDDQIWRTFIGCGITDEKTPRAANGKELKELLQENHRFVFSLIHKFNQPVPEPYSVRDDIIVLSDEAHRTQAGRFARNMRLALPNAAFIGFTGTPLFKHDELTRRIFGNYVSRYDFKRSEEDQSTVKLIYENRGEKLGIARFDLNDRIAEATEQADLDPDQTALLERLLGKDYEVITADDRLDKLTADFVEHCSTHWQSGKSMLVCIDKITCGRMYQRIEPRWQAKITELNNLVEVKRSELAITVDPDARERLRNQLESLHWQIQWMETTMIEIVISEAQNEVRDFAKWDFDIIPHRDRMKRGFETPDGRRVNVEDAFKDPQHPFRIAIVCAMWLTGFDVECLSTLYIDKPMKAHNLMQAIARANRIYPGKDCGVIVDYNGMLKSLREALAQYALGDEDDGNASAIAAPIEELVAALIQAIETAEAHLRSLGFDPDRLRGTSGFTRIEALRDAVDVLYMSDESKRRFEIIVRQIFIRFKTLLMEPSAFTYAERHDNLEAIYKKLQEKRDTADVTALLKELHRIVNEAIRAAQPGTDHAEGLTVDLSQINFGKLKDEFAKKVRRKHAALQDIRDLVDKKLMRMLANNPLRMDYYKKYQEIIADYNREKDRATVEATFAQLVALAEGLDAEEQRAVKEGLTDSELAIFDLLFKDSISNVDRERVKQASKNLLASLRELLQSLRDWEKKSATEAEVQVFILDNLYHELPRPPFTDSETEEIAARVFDFVRQGGAIGIDSAHP